MRHCLRAHRSSTRRPRRRAASGEPTPGPGRPGRQDQHGTAACAARLPHDVTHTTRRGDDGRAGPARRPPHYFGHRQAPANEPGVLRSSSSSPRELGRPGSAPRGRGPPRPGFPFPKTASAPVSAPCPRTTGPAASDPAARPEERRSGEVLWGRRAGSPRGQWGRHEGGSGGEPANKPSGGQRNLWGFPIRHASWPLDMMRCETGEETGGWFEATRTREGNSASVLHLEHLYT